MSTYYLQDNRTFQGNYMMWWAKGRQGYTSNIQNAHVFTAEELAEMSLRNSDIIWNCDYINSKIKHCIDCQDCNHDEMKEIENILSNNENANVDNNVKKFEDLLNKYSSKLHSYYRYNRDEYDEEIESIHQLLIEMFKERGEK